MLMIGLRDFCIVVEPELALRGRKSTGWFGFAYVLSHIALHILFVAVFFTSECATVSLLSFHSPLTNNIWLRTKRERVRARHESLWLALMLEVVSFLAVLLSSLAIVIAGCTTAYIQHRRARAPLEPDSPV